MIAMIARLLAGSSVVVTMWLAYVGMLMAFGTVIHDGLNLSTSVAMVLLGVSMLLAMVACYWLLIRLFDDPQQDEDQQS